MGQGQAAQILEQYPALGNILESKTGIKGTKSIVEALTDLSDTNTALQPGTANVIASVMTAANNGQEVISGPVLYTTLKMTGWDKKSKTLLAALLKGDKNAQASNIEKFKGLIDTLKPFAAAAGGGK